MELITLKNGMRIVLQNVDFVRTCAIYLYIAAGNCYENEETAGSAHFIEHMLFKGTSEYSDEQLARKIDYLGGRFNAYTAKEYTCIYGHVLDESAEEGLELILKMTTDSRLSEKEFESERGVILEEINMYEDSPEDCASELIVSHTFGDSPLKYSILGTRDTVRSFTPQKLRTIMNKFYSPERLVLSVCGKFQKEKILALCEKYIGVMPKGDLDLEPPLASHKSGIALREKDFEQSQIVISSPAFSCDHPDRFAASVYSAIAGGTSSSRLNLSIRERLGLAYSVGTFLMPFKNCGAFLFSAGCSHKNQTKVIEKVLEEMEKLPSSLTKEELDSVKQQFKVSCVMGNEKISALASSAGRDILYSGHYTSTDEILEIVNALTLEDIVRVGEEIWQKEKLALGIVGKSLNIKNYEKIGFRA